MGYVNVFSLDGGLNGWTARGLPTVKPEPGL
jgi:rhodanese-related sulfurtransferase